MVSRPRPPRRPLYDFAGRAGAATASARRPNDDEGAESTLAFHQAALLLDTAGLPAVVRVGARQAAPAWPRELFTRHTANPILSAGDWPYPVNAVFDPAAAHVGDTTVVLARVEDLRGVSHLTVARSANRVDGWVMDFQPLLASEARVERAVGWIRGWCSSLS